MTSLKATSHHLVVVFLSCLRNQENQPIIYPLVNTHTHTHTHTPTDKQICTLMHTHTYTPHPLHTSLQTHAFSSPPSMFSAGVWCHYHAHRSLPLAGPRNYPVDILAQFIDYLIIQSHGRYWSFIDRPGPDKKALAADAGSIGTEGGESPCS